MGRSRHVAAYPISHLKLINFVGFRTYAEKEGTRFDGMFMEERPREELLEHFEGWDEEVQQLLQVCAACSVLILCIYTHPLQCVDKPTRWAIHALDPLPQYVHDRVVLLGDAVCIQIYDDLILS